MALYRFSCYGNIIDEREFYSGEEVYAYAQYLANRVGSEVDFAVMPKYDSVKPQLEIESKREEDWETESKQEDDWETKPEQEDDWETQVKQNSKSEVESQQNSKSEAHSAQFGDGISFTIALFIGIATAIATISAVALFQFSPHSKGDKTHSAQTEHQQSTPAPLTTENNRLARFKPKPSTPGTGASSSNSITESSEILNTPKNSERPIDRHSFTERSDSGKPSVPPGQSASAGFGQKTPANTRKELPTLRGKSWAKTPSLNQLRRPKKQGGNGSTGHRDEAIAQNQLTPTPATTSSASKKLPGAGY